MKSIIQDNKKCFICGTTQNLELHHIIYGVGRRELADKDGLTVWLCHEHHTGNTGVHFNKELDRMLKEIAQTHFEKTHSREEFTKRYGRSYK